MKKINWQKSAVYNGFSLAEALITLLVVCVITIASVPVITKKHRAKFNLPHGVYACYWNGDNLVAKYSINGKDSDGKVVYDSEEGRYACEFNPPTGAKNFVATIVGGGGSGQGAGDIRRRMLTSGQYQNNEVTMGLDGQPSYIKNGAHILQGSGAAKIIPKQEDTYSNAYNDDGMPVGQNGQLSDILTNKKTGTGGLGGMTDGNPSLDGTTQVMFQDGKEISSFNQIYGAGAGGGGGALSVDENGSIAIGNGGDGSSGLVFIQW